MADLKKLSLELRKAAEDCFDRSIMATDVRAAIVDLTGAVYEVGAAIVDALGELVVPEEKRSHTVVEVEEVTETETTRTEV